MTELNQSTLPVIPDVNPISERGYQWKPERVTQEAVTQDTRLVKKLNLGTSDGSNELREKTSAADMHKYYGVTPKGIAGVECHDISIESNSAIEELLERGGLNFNVYNTPASSVLTGNWDFGSNEPYYTYKLKQPYINSEGLVVENEEEADHQLTTRHSFTHATKNWRPVQNNTLVEGIVTFAREAEVQVQRIGSFDDGKYPFAILDTNRDTTILNEYDKYSALIIVSGAHQVDKAATDVSIMALREVCQNHLVMPVRVKGLKLSHVTQLTPESIKTVMEAVNSGYNTFYDVSRGLASVPTRLSEISKLPDGRAKIGALKVFALNKLGAQDADGNPLPLEDQPLWLQQMLKHDEHLPASILAVLSMTPAYRIKLNEETDLNDMPQAYQQIIKNYNTECEQFGSNLNTAFQGVTGYYCHQAVTRGSDRGHYFGGNNTHKLGAYRTVQVLQTVMQM